MTLEHAAVVALWLWGSYYYYKHRALAKQIADGPPPAAPGTGSGYRVTYRVGRQKMVLNVPSAKTEAEALQHLFRTVYPKPSVKDILQTEKL